MSGHKALARIEAVVIIVIVIAAGILGVLAWHYNVNLPQQEQGREILIGASLSLTGSMSIFGNEQLWAYQRAVDMVNNEGGIEIEGMGRLRVRLIVYDDKTDVNTVISNIDKLVTLDGVDFLLGGDGTPFVSAAAGEAEKFHVPLVTGGSSNVAIRHRGFQYTFIAFESNDIDIHVFFKMLSSLREDIRPTTVAVWAENTATGKDFYDLVPEFAPTYGLAVVLKESYAPGATDYSDLITKTKAAEPDIVMGVPLPPDGITLIRQSRQLDFNPKLFFLLRAANGADFYEALTKESEYVTTTQTWRPDWNYTGNRELVKDYEATGQDIYRHTALGAWYSLAQILLEAIRSTHSLNREVVREALLTNIFNTVQGPVKFNENGVADIDVIIFQWQQGAQVTVYPEEYASAKLIYPAPTWSQRA